MQKDHLRQMFIKVLFVLAGCQAVQG